LSYEFQGGIKVITSVLNTLSRKNFALQDHLFVFSKIQSLDSDLEILNNFYLSKNQVIRLLFLVVFSYLTLLVLCVELWIRILRLFLFNQWVLRILSYAAMGMFLICGAYFWYNNHSIGKFEMLFLMLMCSVAISVWGIMARNKEVN